MTAANSHLDSHPNIEQRLEFMQLGTANREKLRALGPVLERELPKALDKFYQMVRKTPGTSRFFSSDQHVAGAKNAQVGHWANIVKGDFNTAEARAEQLDVAHPASGRGLWGRRASRPQIGDPSIARRTLGRSSIWS